MISDEYTAGFFDGEGSVGCSLGGGDGGKIPTLRVTVSNTYLPVLEELHASYGGRIYRQKPVDASRHKVIWKWCLESTREVFIFLRAISPYLRVKQDVVNIVLEYEEWFLTPRTGKALSLEVWSRRMEAYTLVAALNKRGPDVG